MKNKKKILINYDESVENYNNQLVTKLRDFGDNLLDLWVPEENILQSLIGLMYSLNQNNCNEVDLVIKKNTFEKYHKEFQNIFDKFSKFEILQTKKIYRLNINIINQNKLNEVNNSFFVSKPSKAIKSLKTSNIKRSIQNLLIENIYKFPSSVIKDKNLFFIEKSQLKYYLDDKNYINSRIKNLVFFVKISKKNITSVKFNCEEPLVKVLINFSKIIINTPLIEAFEHGIMKLENSFRKKHIKNKIKGIITPYVIKNIFQNLQSLMYQIYLEYLSISKTEDCKNLYDFSLSDSWKKLSLSSKTKLLNKTINDYCKNSDINFRFVEIEDEVKVLIDIDEKVNSGTKKYLFLLNLEKEIRKKLDKRLEVFYKDEPDSNKLRQKNL